MRGPGNPQKGAENLRKVSKEQRRKASLEGGLSTQDRWWELRQERHAEAWEAAKTIPGWDKLSGRELARRVAEMVNEVREEVGYPPFSEEWVRQILFPRNRRTHRRSE